MSGTKTVAFFGATGGSSLAVLACSLKAGYTCLSLVRSIEKQQKLLKEEGEVSESDLANLHIVEGNARKLEDVKKALIDPLTNKVADVIVYGVGARPDFANPLSPKFQEPTICEDTTKVVLEALTELQPEDAPLGVFMSTTGTPTNERDVPYLMMPLYHWGLTIPHKDKEAMEKLVAAAPKTVLSNFIIIKPSLLTDGKATHGKVSVGYEGSEIKGQSGKLGLKDGGCGWKGNNGPAIGYTISRKDVGAFIFEEAIVNDGSAWSGKKVSLTH